MTAMASVITPFDASPAIELGNAWRKRLLPVGSISYQGRELHFTREYLAGLVRAWQDGAYDQVPFQLADASNAHSNDPERTRGFIRDMELAEDGLYMTAELTPRGEQVLKENPYLGVSARIVEQYKRADGKFYPAAVQHVLGTLDPRIPGLGAWQPIDMSNESAVVIDLSSYSFSGEPAPAYADDELTDDELADLLDALDELDDGGDYSDAFTEFESAFQAQYAAEQDRQEAIAAAIVEDTLHPARRDEDKMARIMHRAAQGVYDNQPVSFTAHAAAVELATATGQAPCGYPDEFGRCSARYHSTGCAHQMNVDWLASGPPPETYAASLANLEGGLELASPAPVSLWGDPDEPGEPAWEIPQQTVELAHELAIDWGLDGTPGSPDAQAYADLLRAPAAPVSVADEMYQSMGYASPTPAQPVAQYPGIAELRRQMGL